MISTDYGTCLKCGIILTHREQMLDGYCFTCPQPCMKCDKHKAVFDGLCDICLDEIIAEQQEKFKKEDGQYYGL